MKAHLPALEWPKSVGLSAGLYGGSAVPLVDSGDADQDDEEAPITVPLLAAPPGSARRSEGGYSAPEKPGASISVPVDMNALFSKLNWRLLPLFWWMVVLNYIDRTNLAFAAIQLNQDLGFPPHVYGLGSGLFFTTYATLQIPSNLLLRRFGGPGWLSGIITAWGAIAMSFAFMRTQQQFFLLRALLGVAEAGAFPGMWYMLSKFYPPNRITLAFAVVESGIPLSHTLAGPLAAALLSLDGLHALKGWQWLFILEGIPSLVLAAAMLYLLPASPETAVFLSPEERQQLAERIGLAQQQHDQLSTPAGPAPPHALCGASAGASTGSTASSSLASTGPQHSAHHPHHHHHPHGYAVGVTPHLLGSSIAFAGRDGVVTERVSLTSSHGTGLTQTSVPKTGLLFSSMPTSAPVLCTLWPLRLLPDDTRVALAAALRNKHVWYLGLFKFLRDIAGFGIFFFAPMIVQALINGQAVPMHAAPLRAAPASPASPALGQTAPGGAAVAGVAASPRAGGRWAALQLLSADPSAGFGAPGGTHAADRAGWRQAAWLGRVLGGEWSEAGAAAGPGRALLGGAVPVDLGGGGTAKGQAGVRAALLTSIPFGLTAVATLLVAHRSQMTNERVLHVGVPAMLAGLGFSLFPWMASHSSVAGFVCLCVGVVGVSCSSAPTLALVSELAAGPGLVVALPLYNSLGNMGGFIGPYLIGLMLAATHNSFALPTVMMGLCLATAGLMVLMLPVVLGLPPGLAESRHRK